MTTALPPTRRHDLVGVHNLRDVGGYRAGDAVTRWGRLLRADALHALGDDGRRALGALDVRLVLDLRDDEEVVSAPDALGDVGCRYVHHSVYGKAGALALPADGGFDLAALYRTILDEHGTRLTDAVRMVADADGPVVVHCTAGKDRTGLVVALALSAVGVSDRDVAADYALSEIMLAGEWADAMTAAFRTKYPDSPIDLTEIVASSPAPVMLGALESIRLRFGDAAGYLRAHGMTEPELAGLRAALTH
ncbi:protein-tyrosine-phosphatase [Rhodococcus rhodnii]|uniref:Tyrosine specific protein phosphatases domain-containing protein n=2 Tax=Rhodococcus rhodnii TaxID=38312 RepID=R7WPS5_9NOCA|nr:tyrosine-protein phosphatase [Rhodococcus rhodnii]EOM77311.1 hypothetical protein Rrhod_1264 [Rhodococcus rhodnii LMG 5362]TXG91694.1 protein-tyrosine-phosphatase [Rhodococcus rhodnii]